MKKVIALIGPQDSGKTSTLNNFADWIRITIKEARVFCVKKQNNRISKNGKKEYPQTDRSYLIVINKLIIGVCTSGDKLDVIDSYTEPLIGSDVIFCAAHSETTIKGTKMYQRCGYKINRIINKEKSIEVLDELIKAFNELNRG